MSPTITRRGFLATSATSLLSGCNQIVKPPSNGSTEKKSPASIESKWPQWRLDSRNTGKSPDSTGPSHTTRSYWRFNRDRLGARSPPVVYGGITLLNTFYESSTYAFNTKDGSIKWRYGLEYPSANCPAIAKGMAIVSDGPIIRSIDVETGDELWQTELPANAGSPIVQNGKIIVNVSNDPASGIYALQLDDGSRLWNVESDLVPAPPAVTGEFTVFGDTNGRVHVVNTADGSYKWSKNLPDGQIRVSPIIGPEAVYICSTDRKFNSGGVHAFGISNRDWLWSHNLQTGITASPALTEEKLFIVDFKGRMYALNSKNGHQEWKYSPLELFERRSTGLEVDFSPAIGGNSVYFTGPDGQLHVVNATTGDGKVATSDSVRQLRTQPVLVDEFALVANSETLLLVG